MVPPPVELHAEARRIILELALTSLVRAHPLVALAGRPRPSSAPPTGVTQHPAEARALELERLLETANHRAELEAFVRSLRDELDQVRRRRLAQVTGETLEDLETAVTDRGEGWDARAVAVALRTSERLVQRIRVAPTGSMSVAGRSGSTGRPMAWRSCTRGCRCARRR